MSAPSKVDVIPVASDRSVCSLEATSVMSGSPQRSSPSNSAKSPASAVAPQNPFEQIAQSGSDTIQSDSFRHDELHINMTSSEITQAPLSPSRSMQSSATHTPIQSPSHEKPDPVTPVRLPDSIPRQPQSAPVISSAPFPELNFHPASERRAPAPVQGVALAFPPQQPIFDDDENTEPSSAANTNDPVQADDRGNPLSADRISASFARFVEYTRRRMSSAKDSDDDDIVDGAVISGYLQKLGRNGKWQTRWFETDGECLSYYKSSKRTKLLATLDLEKVGAIGIDEGDPKGCSFAIQVLGRLYHLRAESRASCKDWVITLNRVKEARMQQGNVKLVDPAFSHPIDLLDPNQDIIAPRVVVVANRERTRAVDETQEWDRLMVRTADVQHEPSPNLDMKRRSALGTVVLARWSKRKTTITRLRAKLAQWARSVRKYGCANADSVVHLDRHVHPPGHDYNKRRTPSEVSLSVPSQPIEVEPGHVPPKPQIVRHRHMSDATEDGARYLS